MRRLKWSDPALFDLREIRKYIANDDPIAAERMAQRILRAGNSLKDFPERGRRVARGLRQLSTTYPYLIRYRVTKDLIEIVSVRHGARR